MSKALNVIDGELIHIFQTRCILRVLDTLQWVSVCDHDDTTYVLMADDCLTLVRYCILRLAYHGWERDQVYLVWKIQQGDGRLLGQPLLHVDQHCAVRGRDDLCR